MAITCDNSPYFAFRMGNPPLGPTYDPPIVFPDMSAATSWTAIFWVYLSHGNPTTEFTYDGSPFTDPNRGFFRVGHDGAVWYWYGGKNATLDKPPEFIAPISVGKWAAFGIVKQGYFFQFWYGVEDTSAPPNTPVTLALTGQGTIALDFEFGSMTLVSYGGLPVCNFKFWDHAIPPDQITAEANNWRHEAVYGDAPIWACPLRSPGDTYNHAHLDTSINWLGNHAWTEQTPEPWTRLKYFSDPIYLSNNTKASSWIVPFDGLENADIFLNPGIAPISTVILEAPQFHKFLDRNTIPGNSSLFSITYFGHFFNTGGRQDADAAWALYIDENGVKYNLTNNNSYKFDAKGATVIYGPISILNMYDWQFGSMFQWHNDPAQNLTSTAHLNQLLLFVEYYGKFEPPLINVNGIYILNESGGRSIDDYGAGLQVRIPTPLIRTALIGE